MAPSDTCHRSAWGDSLFHRQSSYDIDKACFQPHYLKLFSLRYQIEAQLTPTCCLALLFVWSKEKGKALALYLHEDELTIRQVDKLGLCPSDKKAKQRLTKFTLILFTALQNEHGLFLLSAKKKVETRRIDLANTVMLKIQLGTSFISPYQL